MGRVETLLLKEKSILKSVDISKQAGYMIGLLLSYIIFLFIGVKAVDLNESKLQLTESQKNSITSDENRLIIGYKLPIEEVEEAENSKGFKSSQLSSLKSIVSKNQVYYLHYILVLFEILVIIFLIRSFKTRPG